MAAGMEPEVLGRKAGQLWEPTEGENDGFPQPDPNLNPPHQPSPCWDPCLIPLELGDHNLTARPTAGPPGCSAGLRTHFPGETSWDQPPCTPHFRRKSSFQVPNTHQGGLRIQPMGKLGLPASCLP